MDAKYQPPKIKIAINSTEVSDEFLEDILQVSVEESLHLPSMCLVTLTNNYYPGRVQEDKPWKHDELLKIGNTIDITLQSSTTARFNEDKQEKLFSGEMTGIECHFNESSQAPIVIRAYDVSHRLHRGRYNRSFQNMTDSDIVKKIVAEMSIKTGNIANSGAPHDYLFQENQTNMEFLRERAFRIGFELYVKDNKLHFCPPKSQGQLNLTWLKDINSFRVRVSSAEQVDSVEVRGWDYQQKRAIIAEAATEQILTHNQNGSGKKVSGKFKSTPKVTVVDRPVFSNAEADKIAQGLYNQLAGEYVCADAKGEGNPEIQVGKIVTLSDMGKYDGEYYITETRHLYNQRIYTTYFTVRGLRGGNLLNLLSPSRNLKPAQTFLVGIVTDNNDPEKWGRVKVKFPTLTEEHNSNWARVVGIGAGNNRGFDCLPEINDEVLVGFEHGDIHRPYVIGGVWNGQDQPPELVTDSVQNDKVRLRTFKTRTGHIFQFVEEDKGGSKAGVYLKTTKGHEVNLNDSQKKIEIKTTGGHQIIMDDQGKAIAIKTTNGHEITMDDRGSTIDIKSTGNLTIKAQGNIEIQAGGVITIQGAQIHLN
ncbi:MAG: VgrG-related protein [Xenococcaceae cyanobacterium MO_167.B27]|nr:VgrG-related protein [Xenococcaceae cyanobacterium MO_167.B27]